MSAPLAKAAAQPEPSAVADSEMARFEGLYRWRTGKPVRAVVLGGKLRLIDLENDDVEKGTTTLKQTARTPS